MKNLALVFSFIFATLSADLYADHNVSGPGYYFGTSNSGYPNSKSYLFRCFSNGYGYDQCVAPTWIHSARVYRQYSYQQCAYGYNWGVDRNILWVKDGCQADFEINFAGSNPPNPYPPNPPYPSHEISVRVVCSSIGGKYAECGTALQYIRQLYVEAVFSHDSCVYGRSYGYSGNRIWVSKGCRAQFVAKGPQF